MELFSSFTETVADPASTTRDNQDTMSGEPPSDVTTKDPFQDMTEQSFTYDYEDTTHSQGIDEEEGKTEMFDLVFTAPILFMYSHDSYISICVSLCVCVQGSWGRGPSQQSL